VCAALIPAVVLAEAVRIGISAPLSGVQAAAGDDVVRHLRSAIDDMNMGSEFGGHRVELIVHDDAYDPERTQKNVRALIDTGRVHLLIGQIGSANIAAALAAARGSGVSLFAPLAGPSSIYGEGMQPAVIALRASYPEEAAQQAKILTSMGVQRVAIVYQDDAFGQDVLGGWRRAVAAPESPIEIVAAAPLSRGDTNVQRALQRALSQRPDAVVLPLAGSLATQAARLVREQRLVPVLMSVAITSESIADLGGATGGIVLFSSVMPLPDGRSGSALLREYGEFRARHGLSPSFRGLEAYVAIRAVSSTLRKLKSVTPAALGAALAAPAQHVVADTAFRTRAPRRVDVYAITRTGVL